MFITVKLSKLLYFIVMAALVMLAILFIVILDGTETYETDAFVEEETILIIDPGHGGYDGGATSPFSDATESELNLYIGLKMAALAEFFGLPYVMTRDSETLDYPSEATTIAKRKIWDQKKRMELINATPNAVLMSIHQNRYSTPSPRGPQAFFARSEGSEILANLTQDILNTHVSPGSKRAVRPVSNDVFIFKNISCPAVLTECGFLSNPEEAALLNTESHRLKIAMALISAYTQFLASAA